MFHEAFWTHDYTSGVNVLFEKLKQGIEENAQVLAFISGWMRIESRLASDLGQLARHAAPSSHRGFSRDDGAVLKQTFTSYLAETETTAILHSRVAENLENKVHNPLEKWCQGHAKRVVDCENRLKAKLAEYTRLLQHVLKQRQVYYARSRQQEDAVDVKFEPVASTIRIFRENFMHPQTPMLDSEAEAFEIAGLQYTRSQLAKLMQKLLKDVTMQEYKVPLFGPYEHVSSGANIAASTRRHLKNDSIAYSEKFGQALVDQGFLKPVAQISNKFESSHTCYYQWQDNAFSLGVVAQVTELPTDPPEPSVEKAPSEGSEKGAQTPDMITEGEEYFQQVLELDIYRCEMEVEIAGVYEYMERCETDRISAIRHALGDFALFSQRPDDHREILRRLMNSKALVDPAQDVAELAAQYRTGPLVPTVTVYQGYNGAYCQTFGVEIKHSGFLVPLLLDYLAELDVPLTAWTEPYKLEDVYKLRGQINTGKPFKLESLKHFSVEVVVGVFREFLLELPESILPFTIYDTVKALYENDVTDQHLVSALLHVSKPSLEALKHITKYMTEQYPEDLEKLAKALALYLFRPRAISAICLHDKHPQLLILELLNRGDDIFESVEDKAKVSVRNKKSAPVAAHPSSPAASRLSPPRFSTPKRDVQPNLIPLSLTPERPANDRPRSRGFNITKGLGIQGPNANPN
ncbi:Rho-GTPase-activating protein 8 [Wickerhamiella sorbophila]|uniref:Rho-GTPase-activating protein 8 n=1 Tax=Wickerhamiella sorbophila TaxID=45607 RepID=A0A2T0FM63_9ASCO|nr:Rho-GTPase-activating protein 8 [Wickerhamiella sorbophila]PRT56083.1 Rho-GTPase-activating protein 8 [Wickerhamiella sorbophila]